jgi:hypothetical protein
MRNNAFLENYTVVASTQTIRQTNKQTNADISLRSMTRDDIVSWLIKQKVRLGDSFLLFESMS